MWPEPNLPEMSHVLANRALLQVLVRSVDGVTHSQ